MTENKKDISLRDQFAIRLAPAFIRDGTPSGQFDFKARLIYRMADYMLLVREMTPEELKKVKSNAKTT